MNRVGNDELKCVALMTSGSFEIGCPTVGFFREYNKKKTSRTASKSGSIPFVYRLMLTYWKYPLISGTHISWDEVSGIDTVKAVKHVRFTHFPIFQIFHLPSNAAMTEMAFILGLNTNWSRCFTQHGLLFVPNSQICSSKHQPVTHFGSMSPT